MSVTPLAALSCTDPRIDKHWAPRFALQIVAEVASRALAAEPPSYAMIMELDRKVREFPVPPDIVAVVEEIKAPADEEEPIPLSVSMGKMVMSHCREIGASSRPAADVLLTNGAVLLWIHRSFFAQAIIDCPSNPLRSIYAASFLASYRASVTILKTIKNQFDDYPAMCSRFWLIWTYAFSAVVVFGTVVTRGPRSPLAGSAIQQLDVGCELFERAAVHSRRAAKALVSGIAYLGSRPANDRVQPILHRLREKANAALSGATSDPHGDGALWNIKLDQDDELDIFAGRTRLVSSKRPSPSPVCSSAEPPRPGQTQAYVPSPTAPPYACRPQQQPIYPPSLPSLPPLRVPETTGPGQAGPSDTKWLQPQSVQTYGSPDVYTHQQTAVRHDAYYPASASYSAAPYGWSPEGSPHVGQLPPHRQQPYPLQTLPPSGQYAQELVHYPEGYSGMSAHGRAVSHHVPNGSSPSSYAPHQELVSLGLASRDSRLDERWTTFMHESGYLDGLNQARGGTAAPRF